MPSPQMATATNGIIRRNWREDEPADGDCTKANS